MILPLIIVHNITNILTKKGSYNMEPELNKESKPTFELTIEKHFWNHYWGIDDQ